MKARSVFIVFMGLICSFCLQQAGGTSLKHSPEQDKFISFKVELPAEVRPFPEPLLPEKSQPGFKIRGTKGWAWEPDQYLAEIPYLVQSKMNFLMSCYTSMFADLEKFINLWWEPIPDLKKSAYEKVVAACQKSGLHFCFALHPQLFSERPYRVESEEDFQNLWQHFAWMQGLGVHWFSLSYDDIPVEGQDKSNLGETHARLANRLLAKLREKDPDANLIFCPVYYWGCGEEADARAYLSALGRTLELSIYVFWTGNHIVTTAITSSCASAYQKIVRHKLIIWDNYPVNDRHPVLHLGPVRGRDPKLSEIAEGYMSNPLSPQNDINRLPLFTCADYAYNPWAYDPGRSIGQAILHLAETPSQRQVLKDLVELYPGNINLGETRTDYNSVLARISQLLEKPDGKKQAVSFLEHVESVLARFQKEFPTAYATTKTTIASHIGLMKKLIEEAPGSGKEVLRLL